jgi:hypothetical protein
MKRMVAQESTAQKDEEIIISIVKEMTESMTGAQRWMRRFESPKKVAPETIDRRDGQ